MKWDDEANDYVPTVGGVLEGTRIHPESYRFATKIASDALEETEGPNCTKRAMHKDNKHLLDELALDAYAKALEERNLGLKYFTLMDIKNELQVYPEP